MVHGVPLAALILTVTVAFYAVDFYFLLRYDPQRRQGKGWSWDYTLLTVVMGLAIILQPVFLPRLGWSSGHPLGLILQVVGLVCIAASFSLHIWARRHLQKFYAERVELQADHRVIQSGPYAHMRHPVITSFFCLAVGVFMLNPALTTILVLIYVFWDFNRAARQEESLLSRELPGYAEYMQRTPRFLPRPWRHRDPS